MNFEKLEYYDVIVCGGGAAGIAAAIGAAKEGAKVCLVEKYGFLGGAAINSQVLTYCGFYQQGEKPVKAVSGIGDELLASLREFGLPCEPHRSESTGNWIVLLDPEILKHALDSLIGHHKIDLLLHTRIAGVARTGQRLEGVTLAEMGGRRRVVGDAFVDASGDANLALLSGVPFRTGDYNNKMQALSMPMRIGGVSSDVEIDRSKVQQIIAEFNKSSELNIPREDGGIHVRLPVSNHLWWLLIDLELNTLDSRGFTNAEVLGRELAANIIDLFRQKLDGFENSYLVSTGPQVGVRETRHPDSRYEITQEDAVNGRLRDDGIARAGWPLEVHNIPGKPEYFSIGNQGYFDIPYDSIRAKGLDNLWYAGRVIGADPAAFGSVRVMGTAFATGQAAGTAAAIYADKFECSDVDYLRQRLIAQGAII